MQDAGHVCMDERNPGADLKSSQKNYKSTSRLIPILICMTFVALGFTWAGHESHHNALSSESDDLLPDLTLKSARRRLQMIEGENWVRLTEESSNFCADRENLIGDEWNTLGFQESLEDCAEACVNWEGCKFAAYRTDSGQGQCNGWFTSCTLKLNPSGRQFIVVEILDAPTFEPTMSPTLEPTMSPVSASSDTSSEHEQLKSMVKITFDEIKLIEPRSALPALIRKAFHDAGHFDQSSGEMRMGCIQHFLQGTAACPQHANLELAEIFVDLVMERVHSAFPSFSMADAVQLLGALAVDELAQTTNAPLLYDRVRTGRTDPEESTCLDDRQMCENLPAFSTRHHAVDDHDDIVLSLNDVWEKEINGKMILINTFSKQDAVALIGAHTVGSVQQFGAWVEQPLIFDNEYFMQLKRVKDFLDSGGQLGSAENHPFDDVRSNWFLDPPTKVEDPNAPFAGVTIMMMDSDLTLVINAPELVEKYATDLIQWRTDFDDAYVRMSELGVNDVLEPQDDNTRRHLSRAEEQLDEDFEFFQNLQILREEQTEKIHAAFKY